MVDISSQRSIGLFNAIKSQCDSVFKETVDRIDLSPFGAMIDFIEEFKVWVSSLEGRKEIIVYNRALEELQFSLVSILLGLYREAFKDLRLALEVTLQGILISPNEIMMHEWIDGKKETSWKQIHSEEDGIYSTRFCNVYCPELVGSIDEYSQKARKVYKTLSSIVHGNTNSPISVGPTLNYSESSINDWASLTQEVHEIIIFTFFMRYYKFIKANDAEHNFEKLIGSKLNHIQSIRTLVGGTVGG